MTTKPEMRGFSLLELLLATALGTAVFALALQLLTGESVRSGSMAQRLQLRRVQQRTLRLLQVDLLGGHLLAAGS